MDPSSGASSLLFHVSVDRGIAWEDAGHRWHSIQGAATLAPSTLGDAQAEGSDDDIAIVGGKSAPLLLSAVAGIGRWGVCAICIAAQPGQCPPAEASTEYSSGLHARAASAYCMLSPASMS